MRDAFARTLYDVATQRPNVYIVVSDISPAGSMAPFRKAFPLQFVNVGVAEQSMVSLCAGLALRGCTAFAYTIATFTIYRPFEQVRVDVCYQNLPVTLVGIGGGVSYSTLGGTHHAQEDVAVMGALPNMSIMAPCDPAETAAAVWACAEHPGPVYLRLGKAGEPVLTSEAPEPFEFGKLRLIKPGRDVAMLSYGPITRLALEAAARLEQEHGCTVAVFSAHTLKPLDDERVVRLFRDYSDVVVVEEHSVRGGLAAAVKVLAFESGARCRVTTFSLRDDFIHVYGSHQELLTAHGITVPGIAETVGALLS